MFPAFSSRTKRRGIVVCAFELLTTFKAVLGMGHLLLVSLEPSVTQRLCALLNGIAVVGMVLLCLWLRVRDQVWPPLRNGCGSENLEPEPGCHERKKDHRFNTPREGVTADRLAAALGCQQVVERVDLGI